MGIMVIFKCLQIRYYYSREEYTWIPTPPPNPKMYYDNEMSKRTLFNTYRTNTFSDL